MIHGATTTHGGRKWQLTHQLQRARNALHLINAIVLAAAGLPAYADELHGFEIDAGNPSAAATTRARTGAFRLAQATQVPAAGAGDERLTLETITVTARRRQEDLQDTPVSISAFSGDTLQRRQVFTTDDLDQVTPNLQFSNNAPLAGNNSSSQIFIRSIGQTDPTSTVDPGVGLTTAAASGS